MPRKHLPTALTSQPLLVINTLANSDLTVYDVAEVLGISSSTINKHLASIRKV